MLRRFAVNRFAISILCLFVLVSLFVVIPVVEADVENAGTGQCYISLNGSWSKVDNSAAFAVCMREIWSLAHDNYEASFRDGFVYGYWANYMTAISSQGNVYYYDSNQWRSIEVALSEQSRQPRRLTTAGNYEGEYRGTMSVEIQYLDGFHNYLGSKTYEHEVKVVIAPPLEIGGQRESNPINLIVGPITNNLSLEGQISLMSAGTSQFSVYDSPLLLQYWNLQVGNGKLSGELVNTHKAEGAVLNYLNAFWEVAPHMPVVWQYAIGKGTTLDGTIRGDRIELSLEGNVTDEGRPFTAHISAVRSD